MADNVSDFLVKRLKNDWNVSRIFGFSGDGINGLLGALNRAEGTDDEIDFIQVRHEENAAFMACAHAKYTGEVGVCLATSGPEAIHLLNGLYDAKMDHQPVVAIVGQQARVPPLPPHITLKEAREFLSFMVKSDSDLWGVITQTWKNMVQDYLPHKEKEVSETP